MRSRAARLTLSVIAVIALAAAAVFTFQTEQQITSRRAAARQFDVRAVQVARAIGDVRAAQQAYVAAGQSVDALARKVSSLTSEIAGDIDDLRVSAASASARSALMSAAATTIEMGNVDRRAREYLGEGQILMAADVLFLEAEGTTALAAGQLEAARTADHEAFESAERVDRRRQAYALAGGGAIGALVLLVLGIAGSAGASRASAGKSDARVFETALADGVVRGATPSPLEHDLPRQSAPLMKAAAALCTDLGRVSHPEDLATLLGKAADLMDASGVVVWLGSTKGADLRPALAHGYPPQALARMPAVPRQADNAAAAAYRTGNLQIVLARPGVSSGALSAPLHTPEGCIGALTAEIKGRAETSDTTQALAAIVAAQLASVLASSAGAAASTSDATSDKVASA